MDWVLTVSLSLPASLISIQDETRFDLVNPLEGKCQKPSSFESKVSLCEVKAGPQAVGCDRVSAAVALAPSLELCLAGPVLSV